MEVIMAYSDCIPEAVTGSSGVCRKPDTFCAIKGGGTG